MEIAPNEKISGNLSPAQSNSREGGVKDSGGGRDFAAVCAGVPVNLSHSSDRESDCEQDQNAQKNKHEKNVPKESPTETSDGAGPVLLPLRETHLRGEICDVQAILPAVDIEKILAAVRTQLLPGGGREITLDLSHSVLEGLRIKLNVLPSGRLAVDFIASSETVKAMIEARSQELGELLRARGVNLASLKSSLGEHAGRHDDPREQGRFRRPDNPAALLAKSKKVGRSLEKSRKV